MNPRLLRPTSSTLDADAAVYLNAVAVADGQQLEPAVRKAINDFVVGCKRDNIWSAIKACCLLAGPRTLAGINVPLVGPTPTFNAFTASEYNRETGLVGNASTMYIDSGRNNNADPQDNQHLAVFIKSLPAGESRNLIGTAGTVGRSVLASASGSVIGRSRNNTSTSGVLFSAGFAGMSRATSTEFVLRHAQTSNTLSTTSGTPLNQNIGVFGAVNNTSHSGARMSFYSIGEHLNLALLDARVSALSTAIEAAI